MADTLTLTSTLEKRGPAAAFVLTDEQVAAVGDGRKTFPVKIDVNGRTLSLRLARMGGENLIGLARAAREGAGLTIGDVYEIVVSAEAGERTVEVPADLAEALAADSAAGKAFEDLAYSHRKEFVRWITEAKRDATRAQRVAKTLEMLREGTHR
jgi:hypothetical protein